MVLNIFQTQADYIRQYAWGVHELLEALLSREALRPEHTRCASCPEKRWAVWRCVDCSLPHPQCRGCIRRNHFHNPLHRIERWTGKYFRKASLWEVGCYILVEHLSGVSICSSLQWQIDCLARLEIGKDTAEQAELDRGTEGMADMLFDRQRPDMSGNTFETDDPHRDVDMPPPAASYEQEQEEDAQFERFLNAAHRRQPGGPEDIPSAEANTNEQEFDPDDETLTGEADDDVAELPAYLREADGFGGGIPKSDDLHNTYVRIVHTNGIHHIALITCECRPGNNVLLDLMAMRLVPASFERIRTLFSAEVLDYFRLSNLEMKASAYQFYQLLRRITMPMALADVVNLYNEFRRMSRIWRWMKKLKWAGFGHHKRDTDGMKPGELALYCPACPQPDINLPDDCKQDRNR